MMRQFPPLVGNWVDAQNIIGLDAFIFFFELDFVLTVDLSNTGKETFVDCSMVMQR